jgi:hypothetical protein
MTLIFICCKCSEELERQHRFFYFAYLRGRSVVATSMVTPPSSCLTPHRAKKSPGNRPNGRTFACVTGYRADQSATSRTTSSATQELSV